MATPERETARWFADEVQPHEPSLRVYLRGAFPTVRDVDDVVQESYLRVWKSRAAEPMRSARAFLFRVARHLAIDVVRRDQRSPLTAVENVDAFAAASETERLSLARSRQEKVVLLIEAIDTLPSRCREYLRRRGVSSTFGHDA